MFSSIGFFKNIACPEKSQCSLPNCIFEHGRLLNDSSEPIKQTSSPEFCENKRDDQIDSHQANKRRRLDIEPGEAYLQTRPVSADSENLPQSISRMVSPPIGRVTRKGIGTATDLEPEKGKQDVTKHSRSYASVHSSSKPSESSLNPRMVQRPPASHAIRLQLITMLYERIHLLNEQVKTEQHPSKAAVLLSSQNLVALALDEEEKLATENPKVYLNVIKLRIMKLKKMKVPEWIEERLKQLSKPLPGQAAIEVNTTPKAIASSLSFDEEINLLPMLVADQTNLAKHGYVTSPPSDTEIEEARQGVETAQGWEICDRCKTRFRVFPGRRKEDGALTSGGQCLHHPGKPRRPTTEDKQTKADRGTRESIYTCCNEGVSVSAGCTTAATHVFKVTSAPRLALTMQFKPTPSKQDLPMAKMAVCFDCEMGYTTAGLELIRLTATSWPSGTSLIDFLVRPFGEILDLNSRFSGVWPKDFANALPYDLYLSPPHHQQTWTSTSPSTLPANPLAIVQSPSAARDLLFTLLHPSMPLIGHALENDLNAVRIIHPSIIDTVLLYPHPRGLPLRSGLKALMKRLLDRDIQMGGTSGHDSGEDARAAGDLVRLKVQESWKSMKREGWVIDGGGLVPPRGNLQLDVKKAKVR